MSSEVHFSVLHAIMIAYDQYSPLGLTWSLGDVH